MSDESVVEDGYSLIGFDVVAAVALARDPDKMAAVYRRVFGSTEGRAILFDLMVRSHVMDRRPGNMSAMERAQMDGMASFMIEVLELAGLDSYQRAAGQQVAELIDTQLMERAHERTNTPDGYEPNRSDLDIEPDDD